MENLMLDKEGTYNGHQAYKNSKAANVMFTYELARQLDGTGITATCICPGQYNLFCTCVCIMSKSIVSFIKW